MILVLPQSTRPLEIQFQSKTISTDQHLFLKKDFVTDGEALFGSWLIPEHQQWRPP
jgi:hypothetical protein